jgi:predicted transcriptional regulator of viral defense system
MALANTYRRRLHDRALDQYGYVTTKNAEVCGVPAVELRKMATRGGVRRVAHGLYRFEDVPATKYDQFMEAVLRVGAGAHLTRDAVLSFHDLGLVNPRRIRVGTPNRTRAKMPDFIEVVHEKLDPRDCTLYEGVPSMTVAKALLDWKKTAMADRFADAARDALQRGLLRRGEATGLFGETAVT